MICLFCKAPLQDEPPIECEGCGMVHEDRPPVVGVNHVSQLLCALDLLAEGEFELEEFEAVFYAFCDKLEAVANKWHLREATLKERLSPPLAQKFGPLFAQLDEAFQLGFQGVEWTEALLAGESEDFDQVESLFIGFFRGVCGASAALLDGLDELNAEKGSGKLFNLPSV